MGGEELMSVEKSGQKIKSFFAEEKNLLSLKKRDQRSKDIRQQ